MADRSGALAFLGRRDLRSWPGSCFKAPIPGCDGTFALPESYRCRARSVFRASICRSFGFWLLLSIPLEVPCEPCLNLRETDIHPVYPHRAYLAAIPIHFWAVGVCKLPECECIEARLRNIAKRLFLLRRIDPGKPDAVLLLSASSSVNVSPS